MKTDNEIKNILKNLPEHKLPDGFRESAMDAVKKAAVFDALEYKSKPMQKQKYTMHYIGLIAAVLIVGIIWIGGNLKYDSIVPEVEIIEEDTDIMPMVRTLDFSIELEEEEPAWSPNWTFIFILIGISIILIVIAFLIHLKRSKR